MAHDVFISYASANKDIADAIVANLEVAGIGCWIAPRDIPPGRQYGDEIIKAIKTSQIFVLVFSQEANKSKYVAREVERAIDAGCEVIPFRIESVFPSGQMEFFLSLPQWLNAFEPPMERHLEELRLTAQAILNPEGSMSDAPESTRQMSGLSPLLLKRAKGIRERAIFRSGESVASIVTIADRLKKLRKDLLLNCWVIGIGVALFSLFEGTNLGGKMQLWGYEFLQAQAPVQAAPAGHLPVVVVDFGRAFDTGPDHATDMHRLAMLLANISNAKPYAIGVDIDFGAFDDPKDPKHGTYPDVNGEVTKAAYKSTRNGVPVFLAVSRGLSNSDPSDWLGGDDDDRGDSLLVAHPFAPVASSEMGTLFDTLHIGGRDIPSMAVALANAAKAAGVKPPLIPDWLASTSTQETGSEKTGFGVLSDRYFLNLGALAQLEREKITVNTPEDILEFAPRLRNEVVIVGSDDPERDRAVTQGVHSGVFLHAVGAYTKLYAPIYEFRPLIRLLLAATVSALMLGGSLGVRRMLIARPSLLDLRRFNLFLAVLTGCVIVLAGPLIVRVFGILWTDYLLILVLVFVASALGFPLRFVGSLLSRLWFKSMVVK